ncbi:hypothetical protein V7149_21135, partial [Bacillus sp. JJ1503]
HILLQTNEKIDFPLYITKRKGIIQNLAEDRGHSGRNIVFYDLDGNKFDVWGELSPIFKEKYLISR